MIKKLTLVASVAALFAFKANAQTHDISLNLAPIAFSNYSLAYYYNLDDNMSVGSVIGYQNLKISSTDFNWNSEDIGYKGFYIAPEFRYYFNPDEGNDGYFAGVYTKFRSIGTTGDAYSYIDDNGDIKGYDEKNTGLSLGITTGRLWATRVGLTFSTWMGIGYFLFDKTTYTNDYDPSKELFTVDTNLPTLDFRVGITVGYRIGM
jgi:hypothetical protein